MQTDLARLDEANRCHDDDPPRGAALLRAIDPGQLPAERRPGYAFLLNHVLGEKLLCWNEALERQRALLALAQPEPPAILWRQSAAAAWLAGDTAMCNELSAALSTATGARRAHIDQLVPLCAAGFNAPGCAPEDAARLTSEALAPLLTPLWQADTPVDAAVAAAANNLASSLLERPAEARQHPAVRAAMAHAAEQAHRFWLRAGTWVNHERALYLRAMVCQALDEPQWARGHAQAALALLDTHDTEHHELVDRAFIELELWAACERLGMHAPAAQALARAEALERDFKEPEWQKFFADRVSRLRVLPGMPGMGGT
jgi:hypothetical protein